jgi:radical SAM superfamily enzyme YgiQ (UPF0313 family)
MYKDKKYRTRSLQDIKADIQMAKAYYGDLTSIFLCDGDAIAIETPVLLEILNALYAAFPSLQSVASYVGPRSTLEKSASELGALRAAGLTKGYLGVETGDDALLREIHKGVTAEEMLAAGRQLLMSDFELSVSVMLGLAGKGPRSREHALATARICNDMKPDAMAVLTTAPVPGTELYRRVQEGNFALLDPFETLEELKLLLEAITVDNLKYVGNHVSNYLPMMGILQQDRALMLGRIDRVLSLRGQLDLSRNVEMELRYLRH